MEQLNQFHEIQVSKIVYNHSLICKKTQADKQKFKHCNSGNIVTLGASQGPTMP
jgi:hypothetical protein